MPQGQPVAGGVISGYAASYRNEWGHRIMTRFPLLAAGAY